MSFVRSVCTAAVAAATVGVLAVQPAMAATAPRAAHGARSDKPVSALLKELQTLYEKTEAASEAYNGTEERLKKQRAKVKKAGKELAKARSALRAGRVQAGRLARQQYRRGGTGLPPDVQLMLMRDPQRALDHGHLLKRAAGHQARTVRTLTRGERRHTELAAQARKALEKQKKLAAQQKKQRDAVRERLKEVERLLSSLTGAQLEELRKLEARQMAAAQRKLLASGVLSGARAPSKQGERALRYAIDQLGKPYVWGAEGPGSFDCSGLTSQAWLHSGRGVPRTSQEQWRQLDHVPLSKLRPGDLVIYFAGATHVALYAGDGMVVQAPRPGAVVKISPIAANPVLGAVRPDTGAAPVKHYKAPELPAASVPGGDGDDEGYSGSSAPGS